HEDEAHAGEQGAEGADERQDARPRRFVDRGGQREAALRVGALEATAKVFLLVVRRGNMRINKEYIRLNLGQWLTVALEFELAADILRTAVAPSWNDIGQLAAIIIIRTTLNFFLQKEIDQAEARAKSQAD
ncbi:MAG: DUF1622 domain-containing protein, partial [Desulfomonile sp.]